MIYHVPAVGDDLPVLVSDPKSSLIPNVLHKDDSSWSASSTSINKYKVNTMSSMFRNRDSSELPFD